MIFTNIFLFLFYLSSCTNIFIAFTYFYQCLKLMYPDRARIMLILCYSVLVFVYLNIIAIQIKMGVSYYRHPTTFDHVVSLWAIGSPFSFTKFAHIASIYLFALGCLMFLFVTTCLVLSLVMINNFLKREVIHNNGSINVWMICCHLFINGLQYFNQLSVFYVYIAYTAPNLTCNKFLYIFANLPRFFIATFVFALVDQCMTYFVCYKYAVVNKSIKVATGKMIADKIADDTDDSLDQSQIGSNELL